jgi:hypothetical protein
METMVIQDFTLKKMEGIYLLQCASGTFKVWLERNELEYMLHREPLEFLPALQVLLFGKGMIPFIKTRLHLRLHEEAIYVLQAYEFIVEPLSPEAAGMDIPEAERLIAKLRVEKKELTELQRYEDAAMVRGMEKKLEDIIARVKEYERLRSEQ